MTAGLLTGVIAMIIPLPLFWISGAAASLGDVSELARWLAIAVYGLAMPIAGAMYGRIFMRAANDRRGGWLFGIGYGFLLWMLAATAAQLVWTDRPLAVGRAAQGVFAAALLFGLSLGILFPRVHRPLQAKLGDLDDASGAGK